MKASVFVACFTSVLALSLFGDYTNWFNPLGSKKVVNEGIVYYPDSEKGELKKGKAFIDEDLNGDPNIVLPEGFFPGEKDPYYPIYATAASALKEALIARNEVETLAEKLETDVITKIETGTKNNATVMKWYKGSEGTKASGGSAAGSMTIREYVVLNNVDNQPNQYGLYEKGGSSVIGEPWYASLPNDNKSIGEVGTGDKKRTELKGWHDHSRGQSTKLASVMTADNEDMSSRILVYNGGYLNYWSVGKLGASSAAPRVDNASIAYHVDGVTSNLEVKGYNDLSPTVNNPLFAMAVNAGEGSQKSLSWIGINDLLDNNSIKYEEYGENDNRIMITGSSDAGESGKKYYLTRMTSDEGNSVSWTQEPSTNKFSESSFSTDDDGAIVVRTGPKNGISVIVEEGEPDNSGLGIDTTTATKDDVLGFDGDKIVWKEYKPIKTDEKSVTTNTALGAVVNGEISISGFATALNDQIPKAIVKNGSRSIGWIDCPKIEFDDASITTNATNGAFEDGKASIYGIATAVDSAGVYEEPYIPYVDGTEDELEWQGISEFFNDGVFDVDDNGKIILNGVEDAGENDIMVVTAKGASESQEVSVKKLDGGVFESSSGGKVTLGGFNDMSTDYLFADEDDNGVIEIPVKSPVAGGENEIQWRVVGGIDTTALEVDSTTHEVTLKGMHNNKGACSTTLSSMMTDGADAENRANHELLAKYTGGTDNETHWVKLGNLISCPSADDATITTNGNNGAFVAGSFGLFGFADAYESAGGEGGEVMLPVADGASDELAWKGISEFFSDKVFNKTSDGKIILNGVSEEGSDKVRILAVSGYDDDQEVSTITFDNASVDGNIETAQTIQMHNFSTAPNPYQENVNFADALTNTAAAIAGMSVPVRYNSGSKFEIGYIPMGKVTGIPAAAVDQKTITIDDEDPQNKKLQIIGAKAAEKGNVLQMGDEHTAGWKKLAADDNTGLIYPQGVGSGEERNEPIEITDHGDGTYGVGLRNWDTETQDFLYGAKDATPLQVEFGDTIEINDDDELEIAGFSTASAGNVPHKKADGSLEWKPVSAGGALVVEGTSGTTVTSATCTNKLSFVSASDSNVKFTVTDEGNGNVKVTIGVYYK